MDTPEEIVSDKEIDAFWENANFGNITRRSVINESVLKCASGRYTGRTATQILTELGLVSTEWSLTPKGKLYLWAAFSKSIQNNKL